MPGCYSLLPYTFILEGDKKQTFIAFKVWEAHSKPLRWFLHTLSQVVVSHTSHSWLQPAQGKAESSTREKRRGHDSLLVSRGARATAVHPSEGGSQPDLLMRNEGEKVQARGGAGWWEAQHDPAVCAQKASSIRGSTRAREGTVPLCPALLRPPRSAASSSGALSTGQSWSCGSGARGGPSNDPRAGTPLLGGEAGRAGAGQPGEEKAAGRA